MYIERYKCTNTLFSLMKKTNFYTSIKINFHCGKALFAGGGEGGIWTSYAISWYEFH